MGGTNETEPRSIVGVRNHFRGEQATLLDHLLLGLGHRNGDEFSDSLRSEFSDAREDFVGLADCLDALQPLLIGGLRWIRVG